MKNRERKRKKKRFILKDYLNGKLKNWKPKSEKAPLSNNKTIDE
ncbi:hypothetical protein ACN6MY_14925 [Peribacillus sp. B-H-3]